MAIREMGKEGLDVATEVSHDHPQRMEMWKCLKPLVSGLLNSYPYFFFRGSFPPEIHVSARKSYIFLASFSWCMIVPCSNELRQIPCFLHSKMVII